jgi:hypothetical protein
MSKLVYNVDPTYKFFIGFGYADPDPLENPAELDEGVWLLPSNATFIAPPDEYPGNLRVFDFALQRWGYIKPEDLGMEPEPEPLGPSASDVDVERDKRISIGVVFGGKIFQSAPANREDIAGAATLALAAIMAGAEEGNLRWADPDEDFEWIAADNSKLAMDAHMMFAFGKTALAWKKAHIFAARTLKDADPIPEDYQDDSHWPPLTLVEIIPEE